MVTISVHLSNELAERVFPLQERLPEIIELGLRQLVDDRATPAAPFLMSQAVEALTSTGIVTLPAARRSRAEQRHPVIAGGPPASEMILAERRSSYEPDK